MSYLVREGKEFEFFTELAVVAFFSFFKQFEVFGEFFLFRE